jgi:hypothetical protein
MVSFFLLLNCNSNTSTTRVAKPLKKPIRLQGTWFVFDEAANSTLGAGPLFELTNQQRLIDHGRILCHLSKIKSGDIMALIRWHIDSGPLPQKSENCPEYLFEGDNETINIVDFSESQDKPMVTLNFLNSNKMTLLKNNKKGQLYFLYAEMQHPPQFFGYTGVAGDKTIIKRIPMVLIPST